MPGPPVEIFYSYSHKDEKLRGTLETHLAALNVAGIVTAWHDRKIGAGDEWRGAIDKHLENARLVLLLISADFLASDYCMNIEMRHAMERHDAGAATVVPIFLRPCDWQGMPFAELQGLPTRGKPVTRWTNRDAAFANIAAGIRAVIDALPGRGRKRARDRPAASRDPGAIYVQGIKALEQGDYDGAIAALDRALSLHGRTSGGGWVAGEYYHRGLARYFKGDYRSAIADWNRTVELQPANAFAYRQRANAYAQLDDRRRALADYTRAIALAPSVAKAYYNRGLLYQRAGQRAKAVRDFRRAVEQDDDAETTRAARQQLTAAGGAATKRKGKTGRRARR